MIACGCELVSEWDLRRLALWNKRRMYECACFLPCCLRWIVLFMILFDCEFTTLTAKRVSKTTDWFDCQNHPWNPIHSSKQIIKNSVQIINPPTCKDKQTDNLRNDPFYFLSPNRFSPHKRIQNMIKTLPCSHQPPLYLFKFLPNSKKKKNTNFSSTQ